MPMAASRPGGNVGDGRPHLDRWTPRPFAGDAHQAAHPLRHQVEPAALGIGAGTTEPGHRTIDETWVGFRDLLVADAVMVHGALAVVLDEYVGAFQEAPQDRLRRVRLHVERDASFVAVHHGEGGRFAVRERPTFADAVAVGQALDLDHVGAHVGQQLTAGGRRHYVAHLDHPDAGKQAAVVRHDHFPLNRGVSLARKARTPSRKSSVSKQV